MTADSNPASSFGAFKQELRKQAYAARGAQPEKEQTSTLICNAFKALASYQNATTILFYLGCRSEVRTTAAVKSALSSDKQIVIPYCTANDEGHKVLGLWRLQSLDELDPGMWNILEPPKSRWGESGKEINPRKIDLIMVPGVAFDSKGGRLGNGQGYYDRLLAEVRPDCALIGVGFECQIFDQIPMDEHDIYLDGILTENRFYKGIGRQAVKIF